MCRKYVGRGMCGMVWYGMVVMIKDMEEIKHWQLTIRWTVLMTSWKWEKKKIECVENMSVGLCVVWYGSYD